MMRKNQIDLPIEQQKTYARIVYARTGFCDHPGKFQDKVKPYGTGKIIVQCAICSKIMDEWTL